MNVPFGPSSIVGFSAAAAAAAIPFIGELASATEPVGVPSAFWIGVSALLTVVTIIGRMWQAVTAQTKGKR